MMAYKNRHIPDDECMRKIKKIEKIMKDYIQLPVKPNVTTAKHNIITAKNTTANIGLEKIIASIPDISIAIKPNI